MNWLVLTIMYITSILDLSKAPPVKAPKVDPVDEAFPYEKFSYNQYLLQVAKVLESDPEFVKRVQAAAESNRTDHISKSVQFLNHNIRSKLDEIKRKEVERLNLLEGEIDRLHAIKRGEKVGPSKLTAKEKDDLLNVHKMMIKKKHINHDTLDFGEDDLKKLIQQVEEDISKIDTLKETEHKEHEMRKKMKHIKKLNVTDPVQKKKIQDEIDASLKRHRDHEKINNPGSEEQLKEVWQKEDKLDPTAFDPKIFFKIHDKNEDGFLDWTEIESVLQFELDKAFEKNNTDDDPEEREHEMMRMRRKFLEEYDTDKDNRISLEEFQKYIKSPDFHKNPAFQPEGEDGKNPFSNEEFEQYQKDHEDDDDDDYDEGFDHPSEAAGHHSDGDAPIRHQL